MFLYWYNDTYTLFSRVNSKHTFFFDFVGRLISSSIIGCHFADTHNLIILLSIQLATNRGVTSSTVYNFIILTS